MNKKTSNLLFDSAFAVATFLIILYLYKQVILATILLLAVAVIGLVKWKSRRTLIIFLFTGIFGAIAEMIAIRFGIWNYQITNVYNIPMWLFIVWANAGAFIYQLAKEIKER